MEPAKIRYNHAHLTGNIFDKDISLHAQDKTWQKPYQ
jgi:hypothetical protein